MAKPDNDPQDKLRRIASRLSSNVEPVGETFLWSGTFSPKAMMVTWVGLLLASVLAPALLAVSPVSGQGTVWTVVLGAIGFGWLLAVALVLYRMFSISYELTTQRLKHRTGILFRENHRIELIFVDDVTFSQGPVETLLGVGTIRLLSTDTSHPTFEMPGIDKVKEVANLIDDARREERRRRGLHMV